MHGPRVAIATAFDGMVLVLAIVHGPRVGRCLFHAQMRGPRVATARNFPWSPCWPVIFSTYHGPRVRKCSPVFASVAFTLLLVLVLTSATFWPPFFPWSSCWPLPLKNFQSFGSRNWQFSTFLFAPLFIMEGHSDKHLQYYQVRPGRLPFCQRLRLMKWRY